MIAIFGGTGFLGSFLVDSLVAMEEPVRVISRGEKDWKEGSLTAFRRKGADVVLADMHNKSEMGAALEDVIAIVNLIGSLTEGPGRSIDELHVDVTDDLVNMAHKAEVRRFIQISFLGASEDSPSLAIRSKAQAEDIVKHSHLDWTIIRPSLLFSPTKFPYLNWLWPLISFPLFLPMVGEGHNKIQPVAVQEVAQCIAEAIGNFDTFGKVYDLAGATEYEVIRLMQAGRNKLKLGSRVVTVPDGVAQAVSMVPVLTKGLKPLLSLESVSSEEHMQKVFGIQPASLDEYLLPILTSMIRSNRRR